MDSAARREYVSIHAQHMSVLGDTHRAYALVGANQNCIGLNPVTVQADLRVLHPVTVDRSYCQWSYRS
ncbi:hypothetical protein, partial [Burkholderia sola]|uniref:hypothetical protein n=1 Tax=Burkholderia sola TaxID=2843302 RepID=UPI0023DDD952